MSRHCSTSTEGLLFSIWPVEMPHAVLPADRPVLRSAGVQVERDWQGWLMWEQSRSPLGINAFLPKKA